jgi:uncharacterized membrane protein
MNTTLLAFIYSIPIFTCILLLRKRRPYYFMYKGEEYYVEQKNHWLLILLGMFIMLELVALAGFFYQLNWQTELLFFTVAMLAVLAGQLWTKKE